MTVILRAPQKKKNVASRISAKKVSRATPTQQPQPIPSTSSFSLHLLSHRGLCLNQEDAPVFIIYSKSARFSSVSLSHSFSPFILATDQHSVVNTCASLTSHLIYDLNTHIISISGTKRTGFNHRVCPVSLTQLAHARCHFVAFRLRACDPSIRGCFCVRTISSV